MSKIFRIPRFARLFSSTASSTQPSRSKRILTQQFHYATRTIQGLFFLHLFWEHFYYIGVSSGPSMLPTINAMGDFSVISMLYSRGRGLKAGDLVSYVHPIDGVDVHVIKRVIGMPGDFVVTDPMGTPGEMMQVPEGHFWATGDNLPYSNDSRHYGPVPLALVRGKVIARLRPDWKYFKNTLQPVED